MSAPTSLHELVPRVERLRHELAELLEVAEPLERAHFARIAAVADGPLSDEAWEQICAEDGYSRWYDALADLRDLAGQVEDVAREEETRRVLGV